MEGRLVAVLMVLAGLAAGCSLPRGAGATARVTSTTRVDGAKRAQQPVRFGECVVKPHINVFQDPANPSGDGEATLGTAVNGRLNVLMQFARIPDTAMRAALAALGVKLGGYVGGNAYYAQVVEGAKPTDFAQAGAISVVQIEPGWKVSPQLQPGRVPPWATRPRGRVEVVISWFPNVNASFVRQYCARMGYRLERVSDTFSNASLTLPLSAVLALASESWVQHIAPVAPPMELYEQNPAPSVRRDAILPEGL